MSNRKYFDSYMELVLGRALLTKDSRFSSNSLACLSFGMS